MGGQIWLWILLVLIVLIWVWRQRGKQVGVGKGRSQVVSAIEDFAVRMEEENEQIIEMVSLLRQKIDRLEMEQKQSGQYLRQQYDELNQKAQRLEVQLAHLTAGTGVVGHAVPGYLPERYRTVAQRLLAGDSHDLIMKELTIGLGEVDLVARLLESEHDGL